MTILDFFNLPEIDVFPDQVQELVTSVYKAAIVGIEARDEQEQKKFAASSPDSDSEVQQEGLWWDDQIQAMKYHAGNMGLVSLICLFDDWLANTQEGGGRESRFQSLVDCLPEAPLSPQELKDMVVARNSIIHHRGKAEFEHQGSPYTVSERFLNFDDTFGKGRVAVEEPLLTDLASRLTSCVSLWNQQERRGK